MRTTTSADGTAIAYDVIGAGAGTVVIVNGALSRADDARALGDALVGRGLRAVVWDRRGRGDSGDVAGGTGPASPDREAEDLAAVIDAVGGEPAVLGHSSGAVLALSAASVGVPVSRLFLSEPPLRFGVHEPAPDLADRLQAMVDEGDADGAVETFQVEGVGLPQQMVDGIRSSPIWERIVPLAQSTVYDTRLTERVSTPTAEMTGIGVPVTILVGTETFPLLAAAADRLAAAMPAAELVRNPASRSHAVDPGTTAEIVADRMRG